MKTNELNKEACINLEPFYDAMENDPKLLESGMHNLLELIISDPIVTSNVAITIMHDYPDLYQAIIGLNLTRSDHYNKAPCCQSKS